MVDPETGLDAIRNVAIEGDRIVAVSEGPLAGETTLDVRGLVVSPGFIDLHNHSPTPLGFYYQALDGVTTSLELEAGAFPLEQYGSHLRAGAALNWGASSGHANMRVMIVQGVVPDFLDSDSKADVNSVSPAFQETLSGDQRARLGVLLRQGLDEGGLGIGLLLDYLSDGVDPDELRLIFDVAAERDAPIFVHVRRGIAGDPAGLEEVIDLARQTGAPVHVCHISHSAMKGIGRFLEMIESARAEGIDITTEVLPYNAGTTAIAADVFGRDWQTIFDITYEDVEWAATGERFNKAMWEEYRENHPNGMVIHHYLNEEWTRIAVAGEGVVITTDGTPVISKRIRVPPQGIGSFSRVLGRYVREDPILDLPTAIEKMTLLPARRLESVAPVFARKGRIQVGADADITIFDADSIIDHSTYQEPFQASTGVRHLLVNGTFVVRDGVYQEGVFPGRRL